MTAPLPRLLLAELIGTFALVFAGCGAVMVDAKTHQLGHVGVAISFGLVIMFGILGALAKFAALPDERERALRDGERLLREPCVAHCHVGFYRDAIDAALADGPWSEAERYAAALEDAARAEPLPAVDLLVARGRALAAAGRGRADRAALEACRRQAVAWHYARYLPALDAALAAGR